ncbi:MAG: hypothetical protein GY839_06985 [candidate division Zixibacteria bacterium]|nr:hypothetical protein [candidate division Zixibacteria bacterium]
MLKMSCNDLTEILKISLDNDGRLIDYSLKKLTCDRAVADSALLLDILKGRTADEILAVSIESLSPEEPPKDNTDEYLQVKHLQAVQSGLEVLMGHREGRSDNHCLIDTISHGLEGTELTARIKFDFQTENIKSCSEIAKEKIDSQK